MDPNFPDDTTGLCVDFLYNTFDEPGVGYDVPVSVYENK